MSGHQPVRVELGVGALAHISTGDSLEAHLIIMSAKRCPLSSEDEELLIRICSVMGGVSVQDVWGRLHIVEVRQITAKRCIRLYMYIVR